MTAMELSYYIINKCVKDDCPITNLQLQNILYLIQRKFLKEENKEAFPDCIEAWQFGPVVPEVYYEYCTYGSMTIIFSYGDFKIGKKEKKIIDPIIEKVRVLMPWDVVEETLKKGGAWDLIYQNGKGNKEIIQKKLIKEKG